MLDFLSSSFLGESVSKFVHETGFAQLFLQEGGYKYLIMIAVGCFFLYLAIKHKFEPMLLAVSYTHLRRRRTCSSRARRS